MELSLLVTQAWDDYGLIDSGHGRKLERYGPYRFIRPEPQAMWTPASLDWQAHGEFVGGSEEDGGGRWNLDAKVPQSWPLSRGPLKFWAANTNFRHLAFFPDMAVHWDWMAGRLSQGKDVLNLFGYTGVGTLACAAAGANVTHVDASKKAMASAVENARLSGLGDRAVRWLVDDALKFMRREVRRGKRYDGIILDPPKYGRGPDGEIWELYRDLPELVALARSLLDANSSFLVLTVYAIRMSAVAIGELVAEVFAPLGGHIEVGEMAIAEEARGRLLPTAIFVRWTAAQA
ncbi:class I SAM-dependent rRNA methyltransferase [Polymorphobacter arshaanensis]|uniref:Class I SAM-dependent rRNA methyltransferase n=1 Tax=Glacieibacterium arshaanense TaxID=2511025 RepID=A0A4Y9EPZ0_9SPHN|nr:class I SAM-dependent methyltransferase [Polymorphobacter arshaanensis]TFU03861.1 class I SAM-dependent rRNA methyltransferase [Polymorphobacter arshaanensis]